MLKNVLITWFLLLVIVNGGLSRHVSKHYYAAKNITNPGGRPADVVFWPNGVIYYLFNTLYPQFARDNLKKVMAAIEQQTCIRFIELQHEKYTQPSVEVRTRPNGCSATLGYRTEYKMDMKLNPELCLGGTLIHELMHVIGFWHEHTRPDRNERVKVLEKNIDPKYLGQYRIIESWKEFDTGLPYDYNSLMHYKTQSFDALDNDTKVKMKVLYQGAHKLTQQRTRMTLFDIGKINRMYKCRDYYLADDFVPVNEYIMNEDTEDFIKQFKIKIKATQKQN